MVVAFLDEFNEGQIILPPRNAHITIKKKFKLTDIDETDLVSLLKSANILKGERQLFLGDSHEYGNDKFMIIQVMNPDIWRQLHQDTIELLGEHVSSRDPHFEQSNYLPHISWMSHGEKLLEPTPYTDTVHKINKLYLIKRIHPTISKVRIIAKINL